MVAITFSATDGLTISTDSESEVSAEFKEKLEQKFRQHGINPDGIHSSDKGEKEN